MSVSLKRNDWIIIGIVVLICILFFLIPGILGAYLVFNARHSLIVSFIKFAILSTAGEMIALRITAGHYFHPGFSLVPRAITWGILGVLTNMAFVLFSGGVPMLWKFIGLPDGPFFVTQGLTVARVLGSFATSFCLNLVFTPPLFIAHAITNVHIQNCQGSTRRFFTRVPVREILTDMNWVGLWDFALKKTIPFFWIPAHTVTFLLPPEHRILVAALLSILLGIFLAFARQEGADFGKMAAPILEKISTKTGCMAFFAQIRGNNVYMAARHGIDDSGMVSVSIGQRFPLYYGAHGKAFAAYLPSNERQQFVQAHSEVFSPDGRKEDLKQLNSYLDKCRSRGFVSERALNFPELQVICAPVLGKNAHITGFIILLGTFKDSEISQKGKFVHSGAQTLMDEIAG